MVFVGRGDWHDPSYNNHRRTINFTENYFDPDLTNTTEGHCQIFLDVYPSKEYVKPYENSIPAIFTTVIGSLFAVMAIIFSVYNRYANPDSVWNIWSEANINFSLPLFDF